MSSFAWRYAVVAVPGQLQHQRVGPVHGGERPLDVPAAEQLLGRLARLEGLLLDALRLARRLLLRRRLLDGRGLLRRRHGGRDRDEGRGGAAAGSAGAAEAGLGHWRARSGGGDVGRGEAACGEVGSEQGKEKAAWTRAGASDASTHDDGRTRRRKSRIDPGARGEAPPCARRQAPPRPCPRGRGGLSWQCMS